MNRTPRIMRPLLAAAVAVALVSTSACGWVKHKFKHNSSYTESAESRPLEVPPDLDLPDTSGATQLPATPAGAMAPRPGVDVSLPISATEAYPRIGTILAGINGVTINGKAEALGSYDLSFKGVNFLIRVLDSTGGSRMMALSADGRVLNSGPAVELMTTIKSQL
jgi:hypothetical protein